MTFFRGTSLRPVPPGGTRASKDARWIDIREGDELDEAAAPPNNYSDRSAIIGSTRAALRAGSTHAVSATASARS